MVQLLQAARINKRYGGIQALNNVDFSIASGEIVGLIGENGAGKSTLIKILTGVEHADSGQMLLSGEQYDPANPAAAKAAGVAVIHQHFELVETLSVAANLFLHEIPIRRRFGFPTVDRQTLQRRASELLTSLGVEFGPDELVADLSLAQRQLLEVARALGSRARLLIMDEPTASLEHREVERLFTLVRQARNRGTAVIFTSHRLEEVMELCDRVTVLRNGRVAANRTVEGLTVDELIHLIVGNAVRQSQTRQTAAATSDAPVLLAENLVAGELTEPLNLQLQAGEVTALTGLLGSGSHSVPRQIAGDAVHGRGTVVVAGRRLSTGDRSSAVAAGVGFVPEDRRRQGLVMGASIEQNILLPNLNRVRGWLGFLSPRKVRALVDPIMAALQIKGERHTTVEDLSGGNQQKVVIARWLAGECRVLTMIEPTHGVDVGAKAEVHRLVRDFADQGGSVLFASVEVQEVLNNSDRTIVFRHGRIVSDSPSSALNEVRVMSWATGIQPDQGAQL